jgi:hypothetical protein
MVILKGEDVILEIRSYGMSLTKEDLTNIESIVSRSEQRLEGKLMRELAKKADKSDVDRMETRVITAIGLIERDHDDRLTYLEQRVSKLEQAAGA